MSGRRIFAPGRLAAAALVLLPAAAWAAGAGGGSGNPWYDLIMKFVNFGILAGGLFFLLRKPVAQGLADRREGIRRELEEALEAKEKAEAKYREYQTRVANLEDEVRRIQEDVRAEGERQRERILEEAERAAAGVRRQAQATGDSEVARARDQLRAEVAELAVQLAEQTLTKAYGEEDQERALARTIENLERAH